MASKWNYDFHYAHRIYDYDYGTLLNYYAMETFFWCLPYFFYYRTMLKEDTAEFVLTELFYNALNILRFKSAFYITYVITERFSEVTRSCGLSRL